MTRSLAGFDVARVRADNPGPLTLTGTNTWIVGREPAWVIDPGPALDAHLDAVAVEVRARGGAGGIALTHDHADHAAGVPGLLARLAADDPAIVCLPPVLGSKAPGSGGPPRGESASSGGVPGERPTGGGPPVAAARGAVDVLLGDGDAFGPLRVLAVPGHADDHLVLVAGRAAFTGDAVLGSGSVFVSGALRAYLHGLRRLRTLDLAVLCPGHGEEVWDVAGKLDEYVAHRVERERALLAALDAGLRDEDELLDAVWADAPARARPFALLTLRAHMEKLREEGRVPD